MSLPTWTPAVLSSSAGPWVQALCVFPAASMELAVAEFAADPGLVDLTSPAGQPRP